MKTLAAVMLAVSACAADRSFLLADDQPSKDAKMRDTAPRNFKLNGLVVPS